MRNLSMLKLSATQLRRTLSILLIAGLAPLSNIMISSSHAVVVNPTFTSIARVAGQTAGGTQVTITGSGFADGATVRIGGVNATDVVVVSSTKITAVTPAHAAGAVSVVITNSDSGAVTALNAFTYVVPIQAAGVGGSNWNVKCPEVINTDTATSQVQVYGFTFNAWGQVFSRLVDGAYTAVTSPANLVGCYANLWDFNTIPGTVNGWQIGSINKDANGYYWHQTEGSIWALTLSGDSTYLDTDNSNPYYATGHKFIFLSGPAVTSPQSSDPDAAGKAQAALISYQQALALITAKADVSTAIQAGKPITSQQLTSLGITNVSETNVANINADLANIPVGFARDLSVVTAAIMKYATVDKVASHKTVFIADLVKVGLAPAHDPDAAAIMKALKAAPSSQINTPAKIAATVAAAKKERADKKAAFQALIAKSKAARGA